MPRGLIVDAKESEVVRLIFHLYADRLRGCRWIANELNRLGHRRRSGRPWHADKVRRIINDPTLTGMVAYDEKHFEAGYGKRTPRYQQLLHQGKHEQIIPMELWNRGQKIKARNRPTIEVPVVSRNTPLTGVVRCQCGAPMTTRSAGKGKGYFYYVCTKQKYYGRDGVGGCSSSRINSDRLHAGFWAKVTEMVCSDEVAEQVYQMTQRLMGRQREAAEAGTLAADLAKVERDIELWYARHDEAGGDAEKDAAWRRIVQLAEKEKGLRQRLRDQEGHTKPGRPLTRDQVREHLRGIKALVAKSDDRGRALVLSLVEHHGLRLQMVNEKALAITMSLLPPNESTERVELQATVTIPTGNKVDAWLAEHQARELFCACGCGRRLKVRRMHYWRGLPIFHGDCRHNGMKGKRAALVGDKHMNGDQMARYLGISPTTVSRWARNGKLPKPEPSISGMLLFNKAEVLGMFPDSRPSH